VSGVADRVVNSAKSFCAGKVEVTRASIEQLSHLHPTQDEEIAASKARVVELQEEERRWTQASNAHAMGLPR